MSSPSRYAQSISQRPHSHSAKYAKYDRAEIIFSETAFRIFNDILKPSEQEDIRLFLANNTHEGWQIDDLNVFKLLWNCRRLKKNVAIHYAFRGTDEESGTVSVVVYLMDIEDVSDGTAIKLYQAVQPYVEELEKQGKVLAVKKALEWLGSWMGPGQ